jgi:hypothetical protein
MDLDLMLLIDKQFLDTPFYGGRQMTWRLQNEGPFWPGAYPHFSPGKSG